MNYLAHHFFYASGNAWHNTGLVLPDLSRHARGRRKLVGAAFESEEHKALWLGCETHYFADGWFHECAYFTRMNAYLNEELKVLQDRNLLRGQRKWFLAHLLSEMLLDRLIMDTHPDAPDHFYSDLKAVDEEQLKDFLLKTGKDDVSTFAEGFRRFRDSEFIRFYREDPGLTDSLNRVIQRSRQPAFTGADKDVVSYCLPRWLSKAGQIKKPPQMGRL